VNNPVLVGGSSAARIALLEGLAQAIAKGDSPEVLKGKQLYAFPPLAFAAGSQAGSLQDPRLRARILELIDRLDLTAYRETVSIMRLDRQADTGGRDAPGTAVRAAAKPSDGRLIRDPALELSALDAVAAILEESRSRDDVILFIDELPKVAGAAVPDGGVNITSILKPLLASGKLQIIGAGTASEYYNSLDGDIELSPWFEPVQVTEPSIAYTVGMLTVALRAATRARIPAG
jgi:ATP-dependent Clp protease ATP-binding subunit ClpA